MPISQLIMQVNLTSRLRWNTLPRIPLIRLNHSQWTYWSRLCCSISKE